jgi:hypothetical protein
MIPVPRDYHMECGPGYICSECHDDHPKGAPCTPDPKPGTIEHALANCVDCLVAERAKIAEYQVEVERLSIERDEARAKLMTTIEKLDSERYEHARTCEKMDRERAENRAHRVQYMVQRERDVIELRRLAEALDAERQDSKHWRVKAQCYGAIVQGCSPALESAGYHVNATQDGGAVRGIRDAVVAITDAIDAERYEHAREHARVRALVAYVRRVSHAAHCVIYRTARTCDCGLDDVIAYACGEEDRK